MDSGGVSDANMQIFKNIGDIIIEPEFNQGLQSFYQANRDKFDDNEENKLEYKQIYEEYISLSETVIEAKLVENHGLSADDIKGFYENFKANKAAYEAENADTVDMLYGMIDFDNFKSKMLAAKKGFIDQEDTTASQLQEQEQYQNLKMDQEWANFQQMCGEDLKGWKRKVDMKAFKNGYKATVHQRKQVGKKIDVIRIDSVFQKVKVADVVDYYLNPPNSNMIKEASTIETYPDGSFIKYFRFKMPMMTDRDNILHISQEEKDGGLFLSMATTEHPSKPEIKGVIRMFTHVCMILRQEGDDVVMVDFESFDMKGYMPASLMNMTYAAETAKEFTNMMKVLYAKQQ